MEIPTQLVDPPHVTRNEGGALMAVPLEFAGATGAVTLVTGETYTAY